MRAGTGDRVYEGNGGRSYIAEASEMGTVLLTAIAIKVEFIGSYRVAHEGEWKFGKVCCREGEKEGRKRS